MKTTLIHSNSTSSLSSRNFIGFTPDGSGGGKWDNAPQTVGCANSFNVCCANACRKKNVERTLPIVKWLPEYTKKKAVADLIAGVTVGLTVLPQGLAYATVAGLQPIYGLYSSFVGCFVYILFGSTNEITIGPTAIQSVLTNKYTFGKPPEYAIFLAAVTAVVTLFLGIFRLGFIANFISRPVISGFTSAVSLTIVATQVKSLLGIHFEKEGFLPTIEGLIEHFGEIRKYDAILSGVCIALLLFMKKLDFFLSPCLKGRPKLIKAVWFISTARSALVLMACTIYAACIDPPNPDDRLFSLCAPPMTIFDPKTNTTHSFSDILYEEASALLVLPILGLMGHITIAKAFAGTKRVDCTQEILCIGISNAISCFFSSYSIGGSFSRTTVNAFSGVASPMGGLYTGIMVLLALQFLTEYFYFIPHASLAAVISCSVIFMMDFEVILPLWRSKKMDLLPLVVTFLVTLFVGLEFGILTGFAMSTMYLLYFAARPRIRILECEVAVSTFTSRLRKRFIMVVLDRSLTFPSVDYVSYEINKCVAKFGNAPTPAVIDCNHIQYIDFTAAEAMQAVVEALDDQGYSLIFYRLKPSMLRIIEGAMTKAGPTFMHCQEETELESALESVEEESRRRQGDP